MKATLIVGCGYLGRRVAALRRATGRTVYGTTRTPAGAAELAALGIEPVVADVLDLASLPAAEEVVYCVGYDRGAGASMRSVYVDGLAAVLDRLAGHCERLVYASSTGVYGRDDGGWVDEAEPPRPTSESGRACLEAEGLIAGARIRATILRFSGLYGPGRVVRRAAIERGEPIAGDPDRWLNLVHIDDAATAVALALDAEATGPLYLVSDRRPVPRGEYYRAVARLVGGPEPRFVAPAPGSPEAAREGSNKRVDARKIRQELGLSLAYPDIDAGLPQALATVGLG